jgi:hypothetical protein
MENLNPLRIVSAGKTFLTAFILGIVGALFVIFFNNEFQPTHTSNPKAWEDHFKTINYIVLGEVIIISIFIISGCYDLIRCCSDDIHNHEEDNEA